MVDTVKFLCPTTYLSDAGTHQIGKYATRLFRGFQKGAAMRRTVVQLGIFGIIYLASHMPAAAQNTLVSPPGQQRTITVACNPFPPSKIANSTTLPGYDVEFLRAAFASRNITLLTPFYPWKRAYFLAQTGQVDGLCSCSYLPEREADFLYSDLLGSVRIGFYATRGEMLDDITAIEDAKDINVGVVNGYSLETTARSANLDVLIANNEPTLLNLLLRQRIDAILSFKAPMDYLLNVEQGSIPDIGKITEKIISEAPYYSCISRKTDQADLLLTELNTGLKTIRDNGLYDTIVAKYGASSAPLSDLQR
jgi:polar amino acid transport system substrate-binding protein